MEYSIGEFSLITQLTVKALRYYQEEGILEPSRVDSFTSYRYYSETQVADALLIRTLRDWDFSVGEIREAMRGAASDEDLQPYLEKKLRHTQDSMASLRTRTEQLEAALRAYREENMGTSKEIVTKELGSLRIASKRYKGRYSDYGIVISSIYKIFGRWVDGKPLALYHDDEYKEDGADFEPGFPVKSQAAGPEIRELPACTAITVIHEGAYDTLSSSYKKLTDYAIEKGLRIVRPTREVYLKGPGMFFKGTPARYLTEIQFPVEPAKPEGSARP